MEWIISCSDKQKNTINNPKGIVKKNGRGRGALALKIGGGGGRGAGVGKGIE